MIIKCPYDKDETTHQHLPVEKISTESKTPSTLISKVASFANDGMPPALCLPWKIKIHKYISTCYWVVFFFELLFLLISYQDGVLELKSPTHSWAFSSILVTVLGSFFQTALANEKTRLCPHLKANSRKRKEQTQAHLVCHFVFKEISENIMRLMANLKRLDDLWGVFIYAILSHI